MFRFTIRDVLWLTVVVALGLGWASHHRAVRTEISILNRMMREMLLQNKQLLERVRELEKEQAAVTQKASPDQN
jgi:hypothetical protein